ncbi:hypothetical protein ABT369_53335 [Dactylosporangium sp. NPDC000244]|uniref:hypothetical protein n=1 Tax=Dactylosporangium sp. NPDC000244 TaxID=3154365 RepID=UPI00331EEF2C
MQQQAAPARLDPVARSLQAAAGDERGTSGARVAHEDDEVAVHRGEPQLHVVGAAVLLGVGDRLERGVAEAGAQRVAQGGRPEQVAGQGGGVVEPAAQPPDRDDERAVQHQRLVHHAQHQVVAELPRQRHAAGPVGEPAQAGGEHERAHPRVGPFAPHPQADPGVQQPGGDEAGQLPRAELAPAQHRDGDRRGRRQAPQGRAHPRIDGTTVVVIGAGLKTVDMRQTLRAIEKACECGHVT